ncbi:hypothetical protein FB45DRAFT_1021268 [Roridomyces roridus]|uniref:F-box domain-containing protein n=1 Tax=Roridomyces roridus TaxID=1738132 RepID=A0AAD7CBW2_9AGAR|nr:hypothetical protein FB45DRAFT_1021268 [Roridomyces roridus]
MSSGPLRARLAAIQGAIVFHEEQLGLLRTQRESTERHLAAIAVYPVLTLPNEITSQIFMQWIYTDDKSNPMLLTWVCKLWREVAISTPQLWVHLKNLPRDHDIIEKWLSRAGSLPLNLDLDLRHIDYPDSHLYETLLRHSSQLETLTLALDSDSEAVTLPPGPFPHLTKLSISGIDPMDQGIHRPIVVQTTSLAAPQLRELILEYRAELPGNALQVYLPCMQLTSLELKANAAECLKFLVHTPNLERFTVHCEGGHFPNLGTWTLVTLPRLLSIHCAELTTSTLLEYFTLPALEELSIWLAPFNGWKEVVQNLIARSGCSIRKLDLSRRYISPPV